MINTDPYPVITISRQFGSGGHTIAQKLSERLHIPFYDKDIVAHVAEQCGYAASFIEEKGEYMQKSGKLWNDFLLSNAPGYEYPQNTIFLAQKKVILEVAQSPCIIVGRCADFLLTQAGIPILSVFIHADDAHRIQRVEQRYGKTDISTIQRLRDKDRHRKAYYRHYTKEEWGVCNKYHIALDSGYLGVDQCVSILADVVKIHHR